MSERVRICFLGGPLDADYLEGPKLAGFPVTVPVLSGGGTDMIGFEDPVGCYTMKDVSDEATYVWEKL
jgi:hypothetical protein